MQAGRRIRQGSSAAINRQLSRKATINGKERTIMPETHSTATSFSERLAALRQRLAVVEPACVTNTTDTGAPQRHFGNFHNWEKWNDWRNWNNPPQPGHP